MAAKIRVSYIESGELQEIIRLLKPVVRKVKVAKSVQGERKRAYIDLKSKI